MKDKKKYLYLVGALVVVVLIFLVVLFQTKTNQSNQPQVPPQTQPTGTTGEEVIKNTNPLINNNEIKQIEADYNKKLKEAGKPTPASTKYQFEYELAPELQDKKSQSGLVKSALAVDQCNLPTALSMVSLYALKNHIKKQEASVVAKGFDIDSEPAATDYEANTFKYYFSNPATNGFLSMYESSGTYMYHQVLIGIGNDIGSGPAAIAAKTALDKYASESGSTKFILTHADTSTASNRDTYMFTYQGDWKNLKMIDTDTIKALGTDQSACNVKATDTMNYVEIHIAKDGRLARFVNQERNSTGQISLPRAGLENALKDFGADPPIPPIVLPEGTDIKGGKVTIDQAVLVYFDYGELFPQVHYVPMYLTSGNVTSGTTTARVFTLIPAVSRKDLEDSGVYAKVINPGQASSLQYGTFKMKPPKPSPPKYVGGCPGNLIDYMISCKANGQTVCSQFFSVPATIDPEGICNEGCKEQHWGVISYTSGEDPCAKVIEEYNPDYLKYYHKKPQPTSGDADCLLNGCPC